MSVQFDGQAAICFSVQETNVVGDLWRSQKHLPVGVLHLVTEGRGCRAVPERRERTHAHQLPLREPRGGLAWCHLLGPPAGRVLLHCLRGPRGHPQLSSHRLLWQRKFPFSGPSWDFLFFFWVAPTGGIWREVWGQSEIKVPRRQLQPRWLTDTQI